MRALQVLTAAFALAALCVAPALAWFPHGAGGGTVAPVYQWGTHSGSLTSTKGANTITVGDLLLLSGQSNAASGTTDAGLSCPSGWTQSYYSVTTTNSNVTSIGCWKFAGAGDTGGAFVIGAVTPGTRTTASNLSDVTGANATTPIDQANAQCSGCASNTNPLTSSTTGALATATDLLLVEAMNWAGTVSTPPTGMTLGANGCNSNNGCLETWWQTLSSSASQGPASVTYSVNTGGNVAIFTVRP